MAANPILDAYMSLPLITRSYTTACLVTTLACQLDLVSPFQLYFNLNLIVTKFEVWRLVTNFFYFGNVSLDFVFHMFFLVRYCRSLEESSFRGRTADFFYLMLFSGALLTLLGPCVSVFFFGSALTFTLVYVWSRRNPQMRMNILGLFTFSAEWLPWVLVGLGVLMNDNAVADLMGIAVGHVYYFLEDVYPKPRTLGGLGGARVLVTPAALQWLFAEPPPPPVPAPRPGARAANVNAGGFAWGAPQDGPAAAAPADQPPHN